MNWTLPLLFILLSPGFLISLGSKSKISIITILIHALIFAIIINVYGPVFEGFQEKKTGSAPTCGIPTCLNGAYLTCSDGGGLGPAVPCSKTDYADAGFDVASSQDKPAMRDALVKTAAPPPTLLNPSDFVREINYAVSRFVPVIPPNIPASMIDIIKSSAPSIEGGLFNGATAVTNDSITQTILNGILKAYPANSNIVCSTGKYCSGAPSVCPNPPACPKCTEVPPNQQSAASKFCTIM